MFVSLRESHLRRQRHLRQYCDMDVGSRFTGQGMPFGIRWECGFISVELYGAGTRHHRQVGVWSLWPVTQWAELCVRSLWAAPQWAELCVWSLWAAPQWAELRVWSLWAAPQWAERCVRSLWAAPQWADL